MLAVHPRGFGLTLQGTGFPAVNGDSHLDMFSADIPISIKPVLVRRLSWMGFLLTASVSLDAVFVLFV
jgi:hypothetical protein